MIRIICGPTASGKTAFAYKLAGDKPASIISADSRQVYVGLDIISGKDIPPGFVKKENFYEKDNLRLWGLDLLLPDESFNAAEFSSLSRKIIVEESAQGREVFIVGGTGFYLKSLTRPETLASVRPDENLRRRLEKLSVEQLQQKLKTANPDRLLSMNQSDVNNPRRLIRALEIASSLSLRGGISTKQSIQIPGSPRSARDDTPSFSWLGLKTSLDDLRFRIESRILSRLDHGAIAEVENLLLRYPNQNLPIYTTLGVKPILKYIAKEIDRPSLIKLWLTDEMNYAKRQLTWFKKQPDILWYDQ